VRSARAGAAVAVLALLSACTERLPPPQANVDAVMQLRAFRMAPVSLASFSAEGAAAANDRGVSVRAGTFTPSKGSGWSGYLRETMLAQLQAVGSYDSSSQLGIGAALVENRSGEDFADGKAVLAARFTVSRNGRPHYDKVQRIEADWNSSFFGFVAYETALRNYTALYPKLIEKLAADPEFRNAVAP
jgi:hypothetical protein